MSTINNLDEKHNDMLEQFHIDVTEKRGDTNLQEERKKLHRQLETLKPHQILDQILDIQGKEIAQITQEIKMLKGKKKKYLLDNSKYIFDFYEQKKQISEGDNIINQNTKVLNSFFKIKANTEESSNLTSEKYTMSKIISKILV